MVVSGSGDCSLRIWSLTTSQCLRELPGSPGQNDVMLATGHMDWVNAVDCAEGYIFSGSVDRTIRRWILAVCTTPWTLNTKNDETMRCARDHAMRTCPVTDCSRASSRTAHVLLHGLHTSTCSDRLSAPALTQSTSAALRCIQASIFPYPVFLSHNSLETLDAGGT